MKVVILAGGLRSTISSIDEGIPKPMVEVGGKPILWHIMKHFSQYGVSEFIVCGGYRVDIIKEYFLDFYIYESDITVDLLDNTVHIHKKRTEDWKVTVVDTGLGATPTDRIRAIEKYILDDRFIVTFGDSISDVNVDLLVEKHELDKKLVTLVLAKPQGRKHLLAIGEDGAIDYEVLSPAVVDEAWVNADCFVMEKSVVDIMRDGGSLEEDVFKPLSRSHQLSSYRHEGFWRTVETKRDLIEVERLWEQGTAPWIVD